MTGYEEFLSSLRQFRKLTIASLSGGAAIPLICYVGKVAPPWPTGAALVTALVELITFILAFQLCHNISRARAKHTLVACFVAIIFFSFVYMVIFAFFTYTTPKTGERWVSGFICSQQALKLYPSECPLLSNYVLKSAEYTASILWTPASIAIMQITLFVTWISIFILLTAFIGVFLIFQNRTIAKRKTTGKRRPRQAHSP